MSKPLSVLLFLILFSMGAYAQYTPGEGSTINYRIAGFSFPAIKDASGYTVEVANGNCSSEDSFSKNILKKVSTAKNKTVVELPSFGRAYTWRVVYAARGKKVKSTFIHFSTGIVPEIDANVYRLNVTTEAKAHKDAYIFVDGSRALYDMKGKPVWFLPFIDASGIAPRDLKLTPYGTITCLVGNSAYEVNYNGEVLWKGPNNGAVSGYETEDYHHEMTRLKNGNYMVLGSEKVLIKRPSLPQNCDHYLKYDRATEESKSDSYMVAVFGTVIEYSADNQVVWSWSSSKYFEHSHIDCHALTDDGRVTSINVHENAFYFDEKNSCVYVSFKNINRIVKVRYPTGEILNEYGDAYENGVAARSNGMFCGQHSCSKSIRGYLITFNNNDCNPRATPSVVMMQEHPDGVLEKVWEYVCPAEPGGEVLPAHFRSSTGGNAMQLPDFSMLAMVSNPNSRIILISPEKEVLWSAVPERWNPDANKWERTNNYRARMIYNPANLEHLIWGEELKDLSGQN